MVLGCTTPAFAQDKAFDWHKGALACVVEDASALPVGGGVVSEWGNAPSSFVLKVQRCIDMPSNDRCPDNPIVLDSLVTSYGLAKLEQGKADVLWRSTMSLSWGSQTIFGHRLNLLDNGKFAFTEVEALKKDKSSHAVFVLSGTCQSLGD